RRWTALGLFVAAVAAGTRFVAIGIVPPSIKLKHFGHATASTELVVDKIASLRHSVPDKYGNLAKSAYALADMASSPEITKYVARAAGLPASRIGVMGPIWTELWRSQQWAPGPKRASQIILENDPYQITINHESSPVIDVETQAPNTETAARLATAVAAGLS